MTIGNRIIQARKEKGLTQEYLAEQLQVSRQAVSKWETGQSAPDTKNLIALSRLLGVSVEYLATGKTEPPADLPVKKPDHTLANGLTAAGNGIFVLCLLCYGAGIFTGVLDEMVTVWVGNVGIGVPPLLYGDSPAAVAIVVISIMLLLAATVLWYLSYKLTRK